MNKIAVIFLLSFLNTVVCFSQNNKQLRTNAKKQQFSIVQNEEQVFEITLNEDLYYNISVEQKGIDIVLTVKDEHQKIIREQDSPNGKFGYENITFSPDVSATYFLSIKPLSQNTNSNHGDYTIRISTISKKLKKFTRSQLQEDFDLLKNAYTETKVGLWYNTYASFDSISKIQRSKITDKMTAWDFYKIVAPLTTYTKEGHSSIQTSNETNDYFLQYGTYFPFLVKILDKKVYAMNDYEDLKTKGLIISKINGIDVSEILHTFTEIEPSDGYNFTSKYRWIESSFARYLLRFYGLSQSYKIEFLHPETGEQSQQIIPYKGIPENKGFFQKRISRIIFFQTVGI